MDEIDHEFGHCFKKATDELAGIYSKDELTLKMICDMARELLND